MDYTNIKRGYREDIDLTTRSSWEANVARYLNYRLANKSDPLISWEYEPETFWFKGIRRGVVSYLPDFKITEKDGHIYYIEVKGYMDSKSKTKLKRMAKYHPNIELVLIDSIEYRKLEKEWSSKIPNWEKPK